jgi:phospholipid N-methyltransferase
MNLVKTIKPSSVSAKRSLLSFEQQEALQKRLRGNPVFLEQFAREVRTGLARNHSRLEPQRPLVIDWNSVVDAGRRQSEQFPLGFEVQEIERAKRAINRLAVGYIAAAIANLGLFTEVGDRRSLHEMINGIQVVPGYARLLERWVNLLADEGILRRDAGSFVSSSGLHTRIMPDQVTEARDLLNGSAYMEVFDALVAYGERLPQVVTGDSHILEFLFRGSMKLAKTLYSTAEFQYMNSIAASVLGAAVGAEVSERQFRVLELGAGTGATTISLAPTLCKSNALYLFTDVSSYFFHSANEDFSQYPFMQYDVWNIDVDNSFRYANAFDAVIAANSLHCAKVLRRSLTYVRSVLNSQGLVILIEQTKSQPVHSLIAMLPGFLSFEDERLDRNDPLLTSPEWKELLRAAGFQNCVALPTAGNAAEHIGQHVIIAQAS